MKLTEEQESLAQSYHDNCWSSQLRDFMIDPSTELNELNQHRNENRSIPDFRMIIQRAIQLRKK